MLEARAHSSVIQRMKKNEAFTLSYNNRAVLARDLYRLGEDLVSTFVTNMTKEILGLSEKIRAADQSGKNGVDLYSKEIVGMLQKLEEYVFSQNTILQEAWKNAKEKVRDSSKYSDVGSKFAYELRRLLGQVKMIDPPQADLVDKIETDYINKHHLLLKSKFSDLQTEPGNLLHAGRGSASSTNTPLHKSMHQFTSLAGSVNYSKMDDRVTKVLQEWVKKLIDEAVSPISQY